MEAGGTGQNFGNESVDKSMARESMNESVQIEETKVLESQPSESNLLEVSKNQQSMSKSVLEPEPHLSGKLEQTEEERLATEETPK